MVSISYDVILLFHREQQHGSGSYIIIEEIGDYVVSILGRFIRNSIENTISFVYAFYMKSKV